MFRTLLAGMRRVGILTMRNIYQLAIIKFLLPLPYCSITYIVCRSLSEHLLFKYGNIIR